MSGELDLSQLLKTLSATPVEGVYVFATMTEEVVPQAVAPRMMFREAEGVTLILLKTEAEANGLTYEFPCRMITLEVHSAHDAAGYCPSA